MSLLILAVFLGCSIATAYVGKVRDEPLLMIGGILGSVFFIGATAYTFMAP